MAWRLMWLAYAARVKPNQPVDEVLDRSEWQVLCCYVHQSPIPPARAPSLGECVEWIASLGGGLGQVPGLQSVWRGWKRLHDLAGLWQLLMSEPA